MVTVNPVARVPLDGVCWNTLPGVESDGPAVTMVCTLNPWPCRIWMAVFWGSPTTF